MDVQNHAFAVYHYLLDSATTSSVTTNRRIYSLTSHIQLGGTLDLDHLVIALWTFMCICLDFHTCLSADTMPRKGILYLINSTLTVNISIRHGNFSFITLLDSVLYRRRLSTSTPLASSSCKNIVLPTLVSSSSRDRNFRVVYRHEVDWRPHNLSKTFSMGGKKAAGKTVVPHGINNLDMVINIRGIAKTHSIGATINLPHAADQQACQCLILWIMRLISISKHTRINPVIRPHSFDNSMSRVLKQYDPTYAVLGAAKMPVEAGSACLIKRSALQY